MLLKRAPVSSRAYTRIRSGLGILSIRGYCFSYIVIDPDLGRSYNDIADCRFINMCVTHRCVIVRCDSTPDFDNQSDQRSSQ